MLLVALAACATHGPGAPPAAPPIANTAPADKPPPHVLVASLERTACYGWCPIYKIAIYRDGTLEYHGERFVKQRGDATSRVSQAQIAALDELFAHAHYFELDDKYTAYDVTDAPSEITSYRLGTQQKTVEHYDGDTKAPAILGKIEDGIDKIVGIDTWIGTEAEREQHQSEWR